jgi:hypothetical protein
MFESNLMKFQHPKKRRVLLKAEIPGTIFVGAPFISKNSNSDILGRVGGANQTVPTTMYIKPIRRMSKIVPTVNAIPSPSVNGHSYFMTIIILLSK